MILRSAKLSLNKRRTYCVIEGTPLTRIASGIRVAVFTVGATVVRATCVVEHRA